MHLKNMLEKQKRLMLALGVDTAPAATYDDRRINSAALGLASEAGEVAQAINIEFRAWANGDSQEVLDELAAEAIDIQLYLLELFILIGYDADAIEHAFNLKVAHNLVRISQPKRAGTFTLPVLEKFKRAVEQVTAEDD